MVEACDEEVVLLRQILQPFRVFRSVGPQFNAEPSAVDPGNGGLRDAKWGVEIRQLKE
jgi:hypothetical protein